MSPTEVRTTAVEFRTDDAQVLGLWTAARLLGVIREVEDHRAQGELLTKAQILLTAFIVGLEPRHSDQVNVDPPRAGLGQVARYDA
jgi:hypothetical protein